MPLRTTARITALRPGQSPPPVSTPMRMSIRLSIPYRINGREPGTNWINQQNDRSTEATLLGHAVLLDDPPAGQVVPGVGHGVVGVTGWRGQCRLAGVLPTLPQIPGEPRQGLGQGRHRAPQLRERDMV